MSILPRETGGGIFGQGMFSIDPSASPDQIARKREMIAALMPRFGQARYVGEGLGQLATGVAFGKMNRNLDKAEGAGRKSAAERFQQLLGGGTAQPGGFSILGAAPQPEPNSPQGIANDTMAALGKGPDFAALEQQYGLPQGYLQRTAQIESGGNPNAQNPNSSAGGMFQFIDSTAKQYGLENKFDPMASADAAARLARDNLGYLKHALGREPSAGELYLAHQQGAGGAAKLLAAGNAPAASVVGADAARLNGGGGMTAADFANQWTGKFGGQPRQPQGAPMEALYAAAADPWLDQGQRAVIMQMIQQRQQDSDPLRQMQLQKGQLELEALRNPKSDPIEVGGVLLDPKTYEPVFDSRKNDPKAPETKQVKLPDGSEAMVQWNPETKTWDPAPLPQGGTSGTGGKLTEGQSKLTLFQTMQTETAPVLGQLEEQFDPANLTDPSLAKIPIAGNYFTSPEYQMYSSAASAWAEGALRISTGAAATQPEIDRIVKVYFAQPGDTPATVEFKANMRKMYDRAVNSALGKPKGDGALILPDDFANAIGSDTAAPQPNGEPARVTSDADYDALPSGSVFIDPEGKQRRKP